jgi:predicted dehydrogenase
MAGDVVHMPWRIVGDRGEAVAANFALPGMDDRVTITTGGGVRVERPGTRPTYTYQLEALRAHLRDGAPLPIDADDALATMELIDACYRAAGFQSRPRTQLFGS